jgi:hypothetical protein
VKTTTHTIRYHPTLPVLHGMQHLFGLRAPTLREYRITNGQHHTILYNGEATPTLRRGIPPLAFAVLGIILARHARVDASQAPHWGLSIYGEGYDLVGADASSCRFLVKGRPQDREDPDDIRATLAAGYVAVPDYVRLAGVQGKRRDALAFGYALVRVLGGRLDVRPDPAAPRSPFDTCFDGGPT